MKDKSSVAPRKKGSWILKPISRKISPESTIITKKYLDEYLYNPHPKQGYALNILFSSDDPNKYNVIPYLESKKVNKSKAIEFAIQKINYQQADDLIEKFNFNIISAIKSERLTLVKYFIEEKKADVNLNYFGSNLLDFATNQEITNYLLEKGVKPLEPTLEKAAQEGHTEDVKKLLTKIDSNNKESALMLAAQNGHVEAVKRLLENGTDTKTQGWQTSDLYVDIALQVNQVSEVREKINSTDIDYPDLTDLTKYIKNILKPIFLTTISSQYSDYNNISEENILKIFPKLLQQLTQDLEKFTQIKNLLESYSEKIIEITTNNIIDDGYFCDPENNNQAQQPIKKGFGLGEIPAISGMFRTFLLDGLNELEENQTSLNGDVKDILDFEFPAQ